MNNLIEVIAGSGGAPLGNKNIIYFNNNNNLIPIKNNNFDDIFDKVKTYKFFYPNNNVDNILQVFNDN
jgi:hypothetical protein